LAFTLKKKTLAILVIVVFVLSIGVTGYIIWKVQTEEELVPEEGEAGLGLTVGEYGCRWDSDCVGQNVECDERTDHNFALQQCKYTRCPEGYTMSEDRLSCISSEEEGMHCGEYGCFDDSDCIDEGNECDERSDHNQSLQRCVLVSCPSGYEMSDDRCSCEEIEPICGDGEFNVTGEECESGNPSGAECSWSECNQSTCRCPTCGDGLLNVTGEECEVNDPSGVSCYWSECNQSSCTCPEEEVALEEDDGGELPETGIDDLPSDIRAFYYSFFVCGGVLLLSYVFESQKSKYEGEVVDKFDK